MKKKTRFEIIKIEGRETCLFWLFDGSTGKSVGKYPTREEANDAMAHLKNPNRASSPYPTAIQRVTVPTALAFGKFFFVGFVPAACLTEDGRSLKYDTEDAAINAAVSAGAERIQRCDCSFVNPSRS